MNERPGGMPERADAPRSGSTGRDEPARPSLTTEVRRRRTDQEFFLRLRDAIQQNHEALKRLGT